MKKCLSFLLVFVMLLTLVPTALASEKIGEEEVTQEVTEGPIDIPEEEPALDGASFNVESGSHYISQFPQGAALVLKGDCVITVDRDQMIESISGGKALTITIESGKTLTVNNTDGHAIDIYSLTVNGPGTLVVNASRNGIYTNKDIAVTGGTLNVSSVAECVYSMHGSVSLNCTADLQCSGGCAVLSRAGVIHLGGSITAVTTDDDSPCILCGGVDGDSVYSGGIVFNEGVYDLTAKANAVDCAFGDIDISGNLKAVSTEGAAIMSHKADVFGSIVTGTITMNGAKIEARGSTDGVYCGGNIVIMDSEVFACGSDYAIYAGSGFTIGARLAVLTPGTGQIKGDTVVYSGDQIAKTVEIGLPRIPGTAKLIYPGDRVYVDDTVSLELTDVPSSRSIQWERSEDGWSNFEDIPGATGETYTVRPEDRGWKIQARITSEGYSGEIIGGGAFVSSRPLTRVDFTSLTTTLASGAPEKPTAVLASGSHCSITYLGNWMEHVSGDWYTGTAGQGMTYYYNLEFTPDDGYTFGDTGTKVPAYLNGTKIVDAQVLDYGGSVKLRMTVSYTVPATGLPITEANFPDAWFRDYISEFIDTEKDGYLTDAERLAVTEIDIDGCENQTYYWTINSLEGIGFFPNLEYLCCGSGLETLDLSGNVKLVEVRLNNDDAGGELAALNVTGCVALESLSLYDNEVSSLDLSTNTMLRELNVDGNQITSLDLSNNTQLESLDVGANKGLTELSLTANTKLLTLRIRSSGITSIDLTPLSALESFNCENCGMTALNVTKNPALTSLYCRGNQLTALDVTQNPKLKYLDCRENELTSLHTGGCPELDRLNCIGNRLAALDLSGNAALSEVYCYGNSITELAIYMCPKLIGAYTGTYHNDRTETVGGQTVAYTFHSGGGGVLGVEPTVNIITEAPAYTPGWKHNASGWWYQNADGSYPANQWQKISGLWYHFDEQGYMQTGWLKDNGVWYYLQSSGAMAVGWVKVDNVWYYMNASGVMQTGWLQLGDKWYYLNASGAMQTGWIKPGEVWYYMDASGVMQTGWVQVGDAWYYMNSSGVMQTGWLQLGDKWYYLKPASGVMAANEWVKGYYWIGSSGVWTYKPVGSWKGSDTSGWWFGDTSGWYAKNETLRIDDVSYTFDAAGYWKK